MTPRIVLLSSLLFLAVPVLAGGCAPAPPCKENTDCVSFDSGDEKWTCVEGGAEGTCQPTGCDSNEDCGDSAHCDDVQDGRGDCVPH